MENSLDDYQHGQYEEQQALNKYLSDADMYTFLSEKFGYLDLGEYHKFKKILLFVVELEGRVKELESKLNIQSPDETVESKPFTWEPPF